MMLKGAKQIVGFKNDYQYFSTDVFVTVCIFVYFLVCRIDHLSSKNSLMK